MLSEKPLVLKSRLILPFVLLCVVSLPGCAGQVQRPALTVPEVFKEPCLGAQGPMETVGDLGSFVIRQEAALQVCEAKRAGLVALVEATQPKARKLWPW